MNDKKIILSLDRIMINQKEILIEKLNNIFSEAKYFYGSEKLKKDISFYEKILKELNRKKYLKKYMEPLLEKQNLKYYSEILKNFSEIDYVLMIGGIYYSEEFIKLVKEKNSKIRFILFLWDKFSSEKIKELKNSYDYIYTFEKSDAVENSIKWRPSFYIEKEENIQKDIDVYFLGENRDKERYQYICELYEFCKKNNLKENIRLFSKKRMKVANSKILTYERVPYAENIRNIKKARVTFEKNIKNQNGLSLRSLECLGYRTKLITTNKDIKNYDFYIPENIWIVDKIDDIKKIPIEFFKSEYKEIDNKILEKYSFEGFINEIFCGIEKETNYELSSKLKE